MNSQEDFGKLGTGSILLRLKGALILIHHKEHDSLCLIGDLKEPCDFSIYGFELANDGQDSEGVLIEKTRFLRRIPRANQENEKDVIHSDAIFLENPSASVSKINQLNDHLAQIFLIKRNLSVSERIWNLLIDTSKLGNQGEKDVIAQRCGLERHGIVIDTLVHAKWLTTIPLPIWQIVRDQILRCI